MDDAKKQLVERLKSASNILVTVSRNPSVDQLAACLGLALLLNKQGKHTAAVFSGSVPSTLEFLKPEETLEKNTDSLRDFIIALDKSKADKLRYKVEDNVVRIFITPYKTSISEADLDFSQGDFNVDLVVALGVNDQSDLDEAITAHGRILHDATVATVNVTGQGGLGSINWQDPQASSLSELMTDLTQALGPDLLDEQIATALLTGIVASTDRFSNDKTSSQTMSASAALMNAGANQQLVASKLEEPGQQHIATSSVDHVSNDSPDGTIEIKHYNAESPQDQGSDVKTDNTPFELPAPDESVNTNAPEMPDLNALQPASDEPSMDTAAPAPVGGPSMSPGSKLITTGPPSLGGTLTANTQEEGLDPSTDPLSLPSQDPPQLLERKPNEQIMPTPTDWTVPAPEPPQPPPPPPAPESVPPPAPLPPPAPIFTPPPAPAPTPSPPPPPSPLPSAPEPPVAPQLPADDQPNSTLPSSPPSDLSLSELENQVKESEGQASSLDEVRNEVNQALTSSPSNAPPPPIQALNAQPLGGSLHPSEPAGTDPPPPDSPSGQPPQVSNSTAPPPVPPPIPFQFGNPPSQ